MNWMDFAQFALALLVVLALIGLLALGLQKLQHMGRIPHIGRSRRLQILENLLIEPRWRMVVVRAEQQEHVLLLGPSEATIMSSKPAPLPKSEKSA